MSETGLQDYRGEPREEPLSLWRGLEGWPLDPVGLTAGLSGTEDGGELQLCSRLPGAEQEVCQGARGEALSRRRGPRCDGECRIPISQVFQGTLSRYFYS